MLGGSKDGQKTLIANQVLVIGALDRIEALARQQTQSIGNIEATVTTTVMGGINKIVSELKTQTKILQSMLLRLGGRKIKAAKDKSQGFQANVKDLLDDAGSRGNLIDLAKVLVVLGAGFFAFGKGLGTIAQISPEQVLTFGAVLIGVFGSISLLFKKDYNISIIKAGFLSASVILIAMAIESVARILSNISILSKGQLFTAVAVTATFGPMVYYLMKAVGEMYKSNSFMDFIGNIIKAPLMMLTAMGSLLIFPIMAMAVKSTALILMGMPSLSPSDLVTAIAVSAAMLPISYVFRQIFLSITQGGTFYAMNSIAKMMGNRWFGMKNVLGGMNIFQGLGAALAIIPILAGSVVIAAWLFKLLPSTMRVPDFAWSVKAGMAMIVFSFAFSKMKSNLDMFLKNKMIQSQDANGVMQWINDPTGKKSISGTGLSAFAAMMILASSIVATAWLFQLLPSNFKAPPISWTLSIGLAMWMFASSISKLIGALQGKKGSSFNMSWSGSSTNTVSQNTTPITAGQMIMATTMIPLVMFGILLTARISGGLPNENYYKAPPLWWTISVGLAIWIFAAALVKLLRVITEGDSAILQGGSTLQNIAKSAKKHKVGWRELGVAAAAQLIVAGAIVTIAFIMMKLPSNGNSLNAPSIPWTIKVGLALYLFSSVMILMLNALMGKDRNSPILTAAGNFSAAGTAKWRGMQSRKTSLADLGIATLAMGAVMASIIALSYMSLLLPPSAALANAAPPLIWVISMGLALYFFTATLSTIVGLMQGKNKSSNIGIGKFSTGSRTGAGAGKLSTKDLFIAIGAVTLIGLAIVAVAAISLLLPDNPKSPSLGWTIQMGLAMIAFGYAVSLLKDTIKGKWTDILKAGAMVTILGAAVVSLAWIMMLLPPESMMKSPPLGWTLKVGLAMILFAGSVWIISKYQDKLSWTGIAKSAAIMAGIAIGLVAVAWIFQLLPTTYKAPPIEWILQVSLAITIFTGIFAVAGIFDKWIRKGAEVMAFVAIGVLAISAALVIWNYAGDSTERWISIAQIGLVIGLLGLELYLLGKVNNDLQKGAIALILATVPIVILSIAMTIWMNAGITWEAIGQVGAALLGIGIIMGIAGIPPIATAITSGALAMSLATIPIILLSVSMYVWMKAGVTWEAVGQVAAVVTGVGTAMGLAGLVSPFIIAGSIAMMVAGAAMVVIAQGMKALAKVDTIGLSYLLESSGQKTESIFGFGGGRDMSMLEWTMLSMARSFMLTPVQLIAIPAGAAVMITAGIALVKISQGLKAFSDLKIDFDAVAENIRTVLTVTANEFSIIGKLNEGGGWFKKGPVAEGISAVQGMGRVLNDIANGIRAWANLTYPDPTDPTGKRKITIDTKTLEIVKNNIQKVLFSLGGVFQELGEMDGETDWWKSGKIEQGIGAIHGVGKELVWIAKGVQEWANLTYQDPNDPTGKRRITIPSVMLTKTVPDQIKAVLSSLGAAFQELGQKNGRTDWFNEGWIEKGIASIKGLGKEIADIAAGVEAFASLKFKDAEGKVHKLTDWQIGWSYAGRYYPGSIVLSIQAMIFSLASVLGTIGKSKDADSGHWWWPGSSNIEKGADAIKIVAGSIGEIAKIATKIADIKDVDKIKTKINNVILSMPEAMVNVGAYMQKYKVLINVAKMTLFSLTKSISDSIKQFLKIQDDTSSIKKTFKEVSDIVEQVVKIASIKDISLVRYNVKNVFLSVPEAMNITGIYLSKYKASIDFTRKMLTTLPNFINKSVETVYKIANIKDIANIKNNVKDVILSMPEAMVAAWEYSTRHKIKIDTFRDILSTMPNNMADAVERIASKKTAMESVAASFIKIAQSMDKFKTSVNSIDYPRLQKVDSLMYNMMQIMNISTKFGIQNVALQIGDAISNSFKTIDDILERRKDEITKAEEAKTITQNTVPTVTPQTPGISGLGPVAPNNQVMLNMLNDIKVAIDLLAKTIDDGISVTSVAGVVVTKDHDDT